MKSVLLYGGYALHSQREERGDCTKVHSITLKEEYEKANAKRDYRFEEEVLEYLKSFIRDNERKIEANKRRLESVEDDPELEKLVCAYLALVNRCLLLALCFSTKSSEIHDVAVQIGELVAKAEKLGNEGNIDESLAMLKDAEEIKVQYFIFCIETIWPCFEKLFVQCIASFFCKVGVRCPHFRFLSR